MFRSRLERGIACTLLLCGLASPLKAQQATLTIEEAVALAQSRNERAAIASRQVEAAEARVARARAFFFPEVSADGSYDIRGGGGDNGFSTNIRVDQTLFDARSFPLYRYARYLRESTLFAARNDRRLLSFDTAEAFLVTLSQQSVLAAAERRRDFARASFEDARTRFEAGLVSSNDVTRSELELSSAEIALQRASNALNEARLALANLIAAEVGTLAEPSDLLARALSEETNPAQNLETAVRRRPDIIALERNRRALEEFAREPSRRAIPSVTANGRHRTSENSTTDDDTTAAVNLSWDIFDGGERRADSAERTAQARIAELNLHAAERRVETDLRTAAEDVSSERLTIEAAERAADAARRNARETGELYRQGLANSLELADANVRRFEAEINEARARYQLALAFLNWRAVLGLDPFGKEME